MTSDSWPVGLMGEVFNVGGKVGIAIPPEGRPGAIGFHVHTLHPTDEGHPVPWADIDLIDRPGGPVAGRVRMNPDIIEAPFTRLADCIMLARLQREQLPWGDMTVHKAVIELPPGFPGAQTFVLWRERIEGLAIVMVDTEERIRRRGLVSSGPARDGQHRHGGLKWRVQTRPHAGAG